MKPTPQIFVSATSADLGKARETVRDALLTLGCFPVVQQHFQTGQGEIAPAEASMIRSCKAVIHLAGRVFGTAPIAKNGGVRRSYTQLEFDAALAANKPLYVFLATDEFYQSAENLPEAPIPEETGDKRALQQQHCLALRQSNRLWYEFSSLKELRELVLKLPESDTAWQEMFVAERRFHLGALVGVGLVIVVGAAVLTATTRNMRKSLETATNQSAQQNAQSAKDMAAIRAQLALLQEQLKSKSPQEAVAAVATKDKQTPEQVLQNIDTFNRNYDQQPNPSEEDKALRKVSSRFIMRGFTPKEFDAYVRSVHFNEWKPSFVVLHNTETPLASWRADPQKGLSRFLDIFVDQNNWSGGPHLFIDDNRIWVLNALNMPGVHARDWNKASIGIELVGNYDADPLPDSVRDTAVSAIVSLCKTIGLAGNAIRLHREQPMRSTDCPGKNVSKEDFIERVTASLGPDHQVKQSEVAAPPSIAQRVTKIIAEEFDVPPADVHQDSALKAFAVDSLATVEFISAVEDEFKIGIADEECAALNTVADLVSLIKKELQSSKPSQASPRSSP